MPTGERTDPYRGFSFIVAVNSRPIGGFSEVTGLIADGDAIEYREGEDLPHTVRKLPGLRKYPNVTLKRGYSPRDEVWRWLENIASGQVERRLVSIELLNEDRRPVISWHLENAWVHKVEGPQFKAAANEVAMESAELVHEGLTVTFH